MEKDTNYKSTRNGIYVWSLLSGFFFMCLILQPKTSLAELLFALGYTEKAQGKILGYKDYEVKSPKIRSHSPTRSYTAINVEFMTTDGRYVTNSCHCARWIGDQYRKLNDTTVEIEYVKFWPYRGRIYDDTVFNFNTDYGFSPRKYFAVHGGMFFVAVTLLYFAVWCQKNGNYFKRFAWFKITMLVLTPTLIIILLNVLLNKNNDDGWIPYSKEIVYDETKSQ